MKNLKNVFVVIALMLISCSVFAQSETARSVFQAEQIIADAILGEQNVEVTLTFNEALLFFADFAENGKIQTSSGKKIAIRELSPVTNRDMFIIGFTFVTLGDNAKKITHKIDITGNRNVTFVY